MLRQTKIHQGKAILLLTACLLWPTLGRAQEKDVAKTDGQPEAKSSAEKHAKAIVPVFTLSQQVLEAPAADDPFAGNLGAEPLKDIVARLTKARDDDNVQAVVVFMEGASMGLAQREELFAALHKIRESGKPGQAAGPLLSELQPRQAASLRRALIQLEILQRESIGLAMPEFVFGEK